MNGSRQLCR